MPRSPYLFSQVEFVIRSLIDEGSISFRAAARVNNAIASRFEGFQEISAGTIRNWCLRLGTAALECPLATHNDVVVMIDHSVQCGQEKCLVVLAIRASELPPIGQALHARDMHIVGLFVGTECNMHSVSLQLTTAFKRIGHPPIAVLSDQAQEFCSGIKLAVDGGTTIHALDIAHKVANILKSHVTGQAGGKNEAGLERWTAYNKMVQSIANRLRMTAASHLFPPKQRKKARFMNLSAQFEWAYKILQLLDDPSQQSDVPSKLFREKLKPLEAFREDILRWRGLTQAATVAIRAVASAGYGPQTLDILTEATASYKSPETEGLLLEVTSFVSTQCSQVPVGVRIPCSTEILESVFGQYKQLSGDGSGGGFTKLLPAIGMLCGKLTTENLYEKLVATPMKAVARKAEQLFPKTFRNKRLQAFTPVQASAQ